MIPRALYSSLDKAHTLPLPTHGLITVLHAHKASVTRTSYLSNMPKPFLPQGLCTSYFSPSVITSLLSKTGHRQGSNSRVTPKWVLNLWFCRFDIHLFFSWFLPSWRLDQSDTFIWQQEDWSPETECDRIKAIHLGGGEGKTVQGQTQRSKVRVIEKKM